ncbi:MAG: hypothetical protein AAGB31_09620, partial [Bdellovibrio sp.]
MRLAFWSSCGIFLLSSLAGAQPQKVDIAKELASISSVDVYGMKGAKNKKTKLSALAKLKEYEISREWTQCVKAAPAVLKAQKELQGWVALTWVRCLQQEAKKKNDPMTLELPLNTLAL